MRYLLAALVAFVVAVNSPCLAFAPDEPKPTIEQLIEKLGDREFKVREDAAKAIEALGPSALPALKNAKDHKDLEIRKRIAQWIPTLERAAMLASKVVSINVTNRPIREAFDALAAQSGYKLELFRDPAREKQLVSFKCSKMSFWEAVDKLCTECGVVMQPTYGDDIIRFQFQDRFVPHVWRRDAFRVVAQSMDYGRSIQFASLPKTPNANEQTASEYLRITINVYAEPRLPLMGVGEITVTEALDDQKNSMIPPRPEQSGRGVQRSSYYWGGYRTSSMTAQLNLAPAARNSRQIKSLKGLVPVTLLAEQKSHVVSDAVLSAKGKKLTVEQVTFDMQEVKELPNKQYEIKMQITQQNKKGEMDHNWVNSLYGRIELQDAKGNKYSIFGSSMSGNWNSAQVSFTFGQRNNAGPPVKLIYNDWITMAHEVPFEFKDLPLP